jgi:hypothetical protein
MGDPAVLGKFEPDGGKARWSKHAVRVLVLTIVLTAITVAAAVAVPSRQERGRSVNDLPAVALGQVAVYRLEVFLVVFYGGLLILVPVYRGLAGGRLPSEISARGAKFAEETADSIEATQKLVAELDRGLRAAEASLVRAHLKIDRISQNADTGPHD